MTHIGIAVGGPLGEVGAVAARAEALGYESIWIPETARTAYVTAAVAIGATSRIRVGTNIALAFPRSPVVTAMNARDLAELSGGRFVLGLGTQVKRVNEFRYATPFEHPAPKIREVVEVCRAVWRAFGGEPIDHRGRFFTVTMPPFPGAGPPPGPIPIHVAAVNTMMAGLAGEVCDGFLGHPLASLRYLEDVARPAIAEGAASAGRKLEEIEIAQSVITSVADRTEDALAAAKIQIAFYGTTRTYRRIFDLHGWGDVVEPLRAAFAAGDVAGMAAAVSDEMAETFAVVGTPDEAREKMRRYDGRADTVILNPPWVGPGARSDEVYERVLETFAPR